MSEEKTVKPVHSETQSSRRLKYGLNVAVAILAAAALTCLLNWLVDRQVRRVGASYRSLVRYDLTRTRQYSLSPQTLAVLKDTTEEVRIVTLLSRQDPPREGREDIIKAYQEVALAIDRTRDLVDEYAQYSNKIKVEHISPDTDVARTKAFYDDMKKRLAPRLAPLQTAVEAGKAAILDLRKAAAAQRPRIEQAAKNPALPEGRMREDLEQVRTFMARVDQDIETLTQGVNKLLDKPMPDYVGAIEMLRTPLARFTDKDFPAVADAFRRYAGASQTPAEVKEQLLILADWMTAQKAALLPTVEKLRGVPKLDDYDRLRTQINASQTVVILGPTQERVIQLDEMMRAPDERQAQALDPGSRTDMSFLGEEMLTGVLASFQLKQMPMVVFVYGGRQPAFGRGGQFDSVARRLQKLNFRVEQWSPAPSSNPMTGQPQPPGPPPQPEPEQKCVWVVLPSEPPDFRNPMAAGAGEQVAKLIEERLAAGDSALFMLAFSPMSRFGMADPMARLIEPWSIKPQTDQIILEERVGRNRQAMANFILPVSEWPDSLPITKAISGMGAVFVQCSPLVMGDTKGKDITLQPLVQVKGKGLWAEKNLEKFPNIARDPATSSDTFTVGVAGESKSNRIIVIADPMWATDEITTNADPYLQMPGLADYAGAAYPGNSELFVNSMYWLARLDRFIATSARSQDRPRIQNISERSLTTLYWAVIVGFPALTALTGVGVWAVRRRG